MPLHFAHMRPLCATNVRIKMETIAIFASGNGTNAEALVHYLAHSDDISVALIATDNPHAGVLKRAERLGIPSLTFQRKEMREPAFAKQLREQYQVTAIVLAGFLGLVPESLLRAFPQRILNIHPGLLPDYGGKGMYGDRVHERVLEEHCAMSGITIHLIDEQFDRGSTLCEVRLAVHPDDTVETLAERIHRLEHTYYPVVVADYLTRPDLPPLV